ncbi:MAG: hypothetical protein JNJ80_17075 [Gemmatimonadetes bacterium]|nr:hypothetical protein [Gemmatimonadota bacterium]
MAKHPLSRISMTIPADVLWQADQLAHLWNRSRSWVISEAVRRLAAEPVTAMPGLGLVAEAAVPTSEAVAAVAEGRMAQIRASLALSPADRLQRAESLVSLSRAVHPRARRNQVIGFDTLEDFALWKKARRAGA